MPDTQNTDKPEAVPAWVADALKGLGARTEQSLGTETLTIKHEWGMVTRIQDDEGWPRGFDIDGEFRTVQIRAMLWWVDHPNADWKTVLGCNDERERAKCLNERC